MPNAVIEDWDKFNAFLAAQPFCVWAAQKRRDIAMGTHTGRARVSAESGAAKNDNAELMAALSSMA